MADIKIFDPAGNDVETVAANDTVFGIEPNVYVMHEVVKSQMAALRQGTANTKTRGMVSGGGRKPFRQKGTGNARQGTIRAPHYAGGGVVFGPHTRSYAYRVNNKVVKLAMRSALSAKLADGELTVVNEFGFEKPSTKAAKAALEALKIKGRTTIVVDDDDFESFLSFRNLENVLIIGATESNCYDLLDNANLVLTKAALNYLEEVLA
ncbi:MAG: 50S ribosomal protein L4 [Coriobacteriales bacterium]|nr:50S ribosomal protein L4 [Coriobacteriaceae bacterium]